MMQGYLYEESSLGVFVLVTLVLGGGASWLTGRAIAITWRPPRQVAIYTLVIAGAVRFIHYSLFDGTLLSLHFYVVDAATCLVFGLARFRGARAHQMVSQYRWLNEPSGLLRWRAKNR